MPHIFSISFLLQFVAFSCVHYKELSALIVLYVVMRTEVWL